MTRLISWLKKVFLCDHQWILKDTIQEQNLRSGHQHWSNIYQCGVCGKHETRDIDL